MWRELFFCDSFISQAQYFDVNAVAIFGPTQQNISFTELPTESSQLDNFTGQLTFASNDIILFVAIDKQVLIISHST